VLDLQLSFLAQKKPMHREEGTRGKCVGSPTILPSDFVGKNASSVISAGKIRIV